MLKIVSRNIMQSYFGSEHNQSPLFCRWRLLPLDDIMKPQQLRRARKSTSRKTPLRLILWNKVANTPCWGCSRMTEGRPWRDLKRTQHLPGRQPTVARVFPWMHWHTTGTDTYSIKPPQEHLTSTRRNERHGSRKRSTSGSNYAVWAR